MPDPSALSALAGSFLARPLASFHHSHPPDDDDDDDEPLFYSSHPSRPPASATRPSPSPSNTPHPAAARTDAGSTDSLPRLFPSTDSLLRPAAAAEHDGHLDGAEGDSLLLGALPSSALGGSVGGRPADGTTGVDHARAGGSGRELAPSHADDNGQSSSSVLFDASYPDADDGNGGASLSRSDAAASEREALFGPPPPAVGASGARAPAAARQPSSTGGKGWLAHQSAYPAPSAGGAGSSSGVGGGGGGRGHGGGGQRARSDSTSSFASSISSSTASSSSSSTGSSSSSARSSDGSSSRSPSPSRRSHHPAGRSSRPPSAPAPLSSSRQLAGHALPWAKYHDPVPLSLFLLSLLFLVLLAPFTLSFSSPATNAPPEGGHTSPFKTLLHALPLISLLAGASAFAPPALLWALRHSVRAALGGAAALGVLGLGAVGWAALIGSFEGDAWWSTTGLRLLSLVPLASAALFGRRLYLRRSSADRTVRVVELACSVLLAHPPLLLLSPLLMLAFGLASAVFLLVWSRLLLIGWWSHPDPNTYHYHLQAHAVWLLVAVGALWVWTWNVVRGVRRVVVGGVVGEWYFHRADTPTSRPADPDPLGLGLDLADVRLAWERATGRSFGSVCLGAGVGGCLLGLKWAAGGVRRATSPTTLSALPPLFSPLSAVHPLALAAVSALEQVNALVLIYVGVAGVSYAESTRAVAGLVRRRGREAGKRILDYTLLKTLLALLSLALSLAAALIAYLFTTHALGAAGHAPVVGLLSGGAVWTTVRFGVDGLGDAADALFVCLAIDEENGGGRCPEAKEAFGGKRLNRTDV